MRLRRDADERETRALWFPNFRNARESLKALPAIASGMAHTEDVTVREYGAIQDVIEQRLRAREPTIDIDTLVEATGLEVATIETTMAHLVSKHEYISKAGVGEWRFELPEA
jgi:hypothetical protein